MPIPTWNLQHSFSMGSVYLQRRRFLETIGKPNEAKAKASSGPLLFIDEPVVELGGYVDCRFLDDDKPVRNKACSKPERFTKHRRKLRQFIDVKLEKTISTFSLST
ncbi:MAG: hypothetical protein ACXV7F_06530 [Methylomonas sp.]